MKKSSVLVILLLVMTFSVNTGVLAMAAYTGSGSGTEADPYLIETKEQLMELSGQTLTQHYKVTADIDLENEPWTPMNVRSGVFDGDGYVISNLKANNIITYAGLFGLVYQSSSIKNLTLRDVNISGGYGGALAGTIINATITNCHVSGEVSGSSSSGGLAGNIGGSSTIKGCSSSVKVSGSNFPGGLIGFAIGESQVERCYATGDVTGSGYAAGFVGNLQGGKVSECYATGNVTSSNVSGFCHIDTTNEITISNCFTLSNVNGSSINAAFAYIWRDTTTETVKNCYSASTRQGTNGLSGIVTGNKTTPISSYFDSENFDLTTPETQARTTAQMMTQANFVDWDFDNIWGIDEGTSYPYLRNVPRPGELPIDPPVDSLLCVLLEVGEEVQLSVTNKIADNLNLIWTSETDTVASVSANGKVTALDVGTTKIWAESGDGSFKEYINVRVVEKTSSAMRLAMNLNVGQTARLYLNDDFDNIAWSSMDPSIVSVDYNGVVTAVNKGLAIVKAEYKDAEHLIYVRV